MKQPHDPVLDQKIRLLRRDIEKWARQRGLWHDCAFFDYIERVKPVEWPGTPYVLALAADGPMSTIAISRDHGGSDTAMALSDEFDTILEAHNFWYENWDHTEMWIYSTDEVLEDRFAEYVRWKWICSLIRPDFDTLNSELYDYLKNRPYQLQKLHWRDFENLVAALLESQGYQTEVGPGRDDGGVDVRLLQRDPIGDIMTLVQVKRYRRDRKVELAAVQALHGAASAEDASKTMFVTTSMYRPSARRFADRRSVEMTLYTSDDVEKWINDATRGIVEDKKKLVTDQNIERAVSDARRDTKQVLHSSGGYGMTTNQFAVVLKETRASALLLELARETTEHDGYGQQGREVPDVRSEISLRQLDSSRIRRARKGQEASAREFWDGQHLYTPWDGEPACFDYRD